MKDLYLCHHGVQGQKWGVRRYQNKDGSLTTAGKKRYGASFEEAQKGRFELGKRATLSNRAYAMSKNEKNRAYWKTRSEKDQQRAFNEVKKLQQKYGKEKIKDLRVKDGKIDDKVFTGKEFATRMAIGIGGLGLGVLPAAPGWPFALMLPSKTMTTINYKTGTQRRIGLEQENKLEKTINFANEEIEAFAKKLKRS
jgi:hypothetical protein